MVQQRNEMRFKLRGARSPGAPMAHKPSARYREPGSSGLKARKKPGSLTCSQAKSRPMQRERQIHCLG